MTLRPPAAVGAVVAALAMVLAACSSGADPGPPATSQSPTQAGVSPQAWEPVPPDSEGALPPGNYGLTANGSPGMPWAVVEVVGALSSKGEWLLHDEDSGTGGMGYWTVTGVYRDPCRKAAGLIDLGTHADGLAAALGQQQLSQVTQPVPITIDGYDGLYLELQAPPDIDFAKCGYDVWTAPPAAADTCRSRARSTGSGSSTSRTTRSSSTPPSGQRGRNPPSNNSATWSSPSTSSRAPDRSPPILSLPASARGPDRNRRGGPTVS